ncbi:MAG: TfoX/Sxy family DNA transformation protein [Candidatus Bipolaricaulota bacterium]|nr:TfoX/Sxy family DNA transformation protein [Candidatus Bipolaricaulota bacterium]
MKRQEAETLESLTNIGTEVAARLREAGILTPDDLRHLGSVSAALCLASTRPEDPPCRSMLSGLEGAIRGVRWHAIPKDERERLWEEYRSRAGGSQGACGK